MPEVIANKNIIKERTEEVTYIIERMPSRFGFYVTIIVLGLLCFLFLFGFLIKYPDVLIGQLTLTTSQSPARLTAANTGRIQLLRENGTAIKADQYVAVIHNAASTEDVVLVDSLLKAINIHSPNYDKHRKLFPQNVSLGEMSNMYYGFLNNLYQYLDYYHEHLFEKQKDILEKLSTSQKQSYTQLTEEYERLKNKYALAVKMFKRDSVLFINKVIAALEFEKSKMSLLTSEQEFKSFNLRLVNNEYNIQDADNKIQQLIVQHFEKDRQLQVDLLNSYYELQQGISQWEHKYVFIAPLNGNIEYLNFWKNEDYIQTGQEIFLIMPHENTIIGQMLLPEQGAGKVRAGQEVIIKLDNYPYTEYGSIKGLVSRISAVTNQQITATTGQQHINTYLVNITMPKGMQTNYGTQLPFHFEAKGTGEIITKKRRLIERLFDNLKYETN